MTERRTSNPTRPATHRRRTAPPIANEAEKREALAALGATELTDELFFSAAPRDKIGDIHSFEDAASFLVHDDAGTLNTGKTLALLEGEHQNVMRSDADARMALLLEWEKLAAAIRAGDNAKALVAVEAVRTAERRGREPLTQLDRVYRATRYVLVRLLPGALRAVDGAAEGGKKHGKYDYDAIRTSVEQNLATRRAKSGKRLGDLTRAREDAQKSYGCVFRTVESASRGIR